MWAAVLEVLKSERHTKKLWDWNPSWMMCSNKILQCKQTAAQCFNAASLLMDNRCVCNHMMLWKRRQRGSCVSAHHQHPLRTFSKWTNFCLFVGEDVQQQRLRLLAGFPTQLVSGCTPTHCTDSATHFMQSGLCPVREAWKSLKLIFVNKK